MVVKFILVCFFVLFGSFRKKKNNALSLLLTLECLVLFLFIMLCFLDELYFRVIFLRVGACEAAVGLGCLVGLIRLVGQNYVTLLECGNKLCYQLRCIKHFYHHFKFRLFIHISRFFKFFSYF